MLCEEGGLAPVDTVITGMSLRVPGVGVVVRCVGAVVGVMGVIGVDRRPFSDGRLPHDNVRERLS